MIFFICSRFTCTFDFIVSIGCVTTLPIIEATEDPIDRARASYLSDFISLQRIIFYSLIISRMQAETSLVHEHLWHHLIPQEYVVPAHIFKLSKDQTTGLIESDKTPRAD